MTETAAPYQLSQQELHDIAAPFADTPPMDCLSCGCLLGECACACEECARDHPYQPWDGEDLAWSEPAPLTLEQDLLAALQKAQWYVRRQSHGSPTCDCDPCRDLRAIRAAIARATGEVPS